MEMALNNELFEMNNDDLMCIEGGAVGTGVVITLLLLAPVPVAPAITAVAASYGAGYAIGKMIAHATK